MLLCKFCGKECKNDNSLRNHQRLCKENPERQSPTRGMLGKQSWNKGLTAESDVRVFKNRKSQRSQRKENGSNWTGRKHSEKTKDLMSIRACERLSKNSKYSKNVEYKPGVILESSYEIKTATILDDLGVEWIKYRSGFVWNDNGKTRRYVPDFYLPSLDIYLDPKNDYLIKKDDKKIKSAMSLNNIQVIVLPYTQINETFLRELLVERNKPIPPLAHGEQVGL